MLRSDSLVPCFAHGVLAALLVVATAGSAGAGVEIGLNFTGRVGPAASNVIGWPDPMGAVGEQHIVELLNDGYAVYRKSDGARVESTSTLNEFWQAAGVTPVGYANNSRVLYDAASQRWFAVSTDGWTGNEFLPNGYLVAVSKSADPTEGWTRFKIDGDPTDTGAVHYSYLGIDADGLYLVAQRNAVGTEPSPVLSSTLIVLPKQDLLAPAPSVANATNWSNVTFSQVGQNAQPVVNLDGTGLPATLLEGVYASLGFLQSTKIGGTIESPVLARSRFIAVPVTEGGTVPYIAAQPGPKADLYAGFGTISANAVQVDGSIWAAQTTRVDGRLAVRWYEIDAATDTLLQSGDVTDPTLDLYFPSIAVNPFGQVVIGMSGSSETDFVGSYAAVGETLEGVTSFGDPLLLQAGRAGYERILPVFGNRWGQYSATVVDPSDPHRFWTFHDYVEAEDTYGIRITELIVTPEPQCSDGINNDEDGLIDMADPGCPFPEATTESPQCDDGIDNDGNGSTDFADSKCQPSWPYWETPPCGLGAELALVMPLLGLAASRRRRAAN
jgi:hypothetical protein